MMTNTGRDPSNGRKANPLPDVRSGIYHRNNVTHQIIYVFFIEMFKLRSFAMDSLLQRIEAFYGVMKACRQIVQICLQTGAWY